MPFVDRAFEPDFAAVQAEFRAVAEEEESEASVREGGDTLSVVFVDGAADGAHD